MDDGSLAGRERIVHSRGWWWLKHLYFTMPWWIPNGDIKLDLKYLKGAKMEKEKCFVKCWVSQLKVDRNVKNFYHCIE